MRIVLLFLSLFIISKSVYAQNHLSLHELLQSIKNGESTRNLSQELLVDQEFMHHTFRGYDLLIVDQSNYRVLAQEDNFELSIIARNGQTKGFLIDHSQDMGYQVRYTNQLELLPSPKEELIFICKSTEEHPSHNHNLSNTKQQKTAPNFGNLNQVSDLQFLESKKGATNLIYIDYDGEAELPGWETYHYSAKQEAIPEEIKKSIWESIAEDFIQFDVNVTTNRALFEQHSELNRQMLVVAEFGAPGWLGVAFLESFGSGKPALMDLPSDYNEESIRYLYRTGSHELGHTFGLNHDGGTSGVYYNGHGEFTPIMGTGIRPVSHWSKGDYASATNFQDDIQIINDWLGTNPDDYPHATDLNYSNTQDVDPAENFGIIETRDDRDTFRVVLEEYGSIRLKVSSPIDYRTNLDVLLQLVASDKSTVIETNNPIGDRSAFIDLSLEKGTYYLVVDGGGELGSADGFSDYGSLGYYEISGLVGYISPICDFSVSSHALCVEEETMVANNSLGTDISYEWSTSEYTNEINTNESPTFSFTTYGEHSIILTLSNNAGSISCETQVKVGSHPIHLVLPAEKTNEKVNIVFQENGNVLKEVSYPDLIEEEDTLFYDFCLVSDCYQISLTDIFNEETCGFSAWDGSKAYDGNDKVVYQGKIYRAKWWTKGDNPTTSGSPWANEGLCEITDDQTKISFYDGEISIPFYQTTPLLVGEDLSDQANECIGVVSNVVIEENINQIKVYPNPIENQLFIEANPIENQLFIEANELKKVIVFDVSGKELVSVSTDENQYIINTTAWENGVYFIHINTQSTTYIQKVLK